MTDDFKKWFAQEWAAYPDKAFTDKVIAQAWALKSWKAIEAARATAEQSETKLDKRAQVGNTRFGVGVKWSTVIGAAQRYHDFMNTSEKEGERIKNAKAFMDVLTASNQPDAPVTILDQVWNILMDQKQPHLAVRMNDALKLLDDAIKSQQDAAIESGESS